MNIWNQIACDAVWTPAAICASGRNSKIAELNQTVIKLALTKFA